MKIYVMVDIEGISGIYTKSQVLPTENKFNEGRRFMTDEINACVAGLKAAGVDDVYVHDCHGGGYTAFLDEISEDVDYFVTGSIGDKRYDELISECDGIILLGYHAMAGTMNAVLEHTYNSQRIQNMRINGIKVGEIATDAAIAGEKGVPVIMVSGDDKACSEAEQLLPGVVTAVVKKGFNNYGARLIPPKRAQEIIKEKSIQAVNEIKKRVVYIIDSPVSIEIELMERCELPSCKAKPYMKIIDGRTYVVAGENVEDAFYKAFK